MRAIIGLGLGLGVKIYFNQPKKSGFLVGLLVSRLEIPIMGPVIEQRNDFFKLSVASVFFLQKGWVELARTRQLWG
jgi:hypothetical protein